LKGRQKILTADAVKKNDFQGGEIGEGQKKLKGKDQRKILQKKKGGRNRHTCGEERHENKGKAKSGE